MPSTPTSPPSDFDSLTEREQACWVSLNTLQWPFCNQWDSKYAKIEGLEAVLRVMNNRVDLSDEAQSTLMPFDEMVDVLLGRGYEGKQFFKWLGEMGLDYVERHCITEEEALRAFDNVVEHGASLYGKDGKVLPALWAYRASPFLFQRYLQTCEERMGEEELSRFYNYRGSRGGQTTLMFDMIQNMHDPRTYQSFEYLLDSKYPKDQLSQDGYNALEFATLELATLYLPRQSMTCVTLLIKKGFDPFLRTNLIGAQGPVSVDTYIQGIIQANRIDVEHQQSYQDAIREHLAQQIPQASKPATSAPRI